MSKSSTLTTERLCRTSIERSIGSENPAALRITDRAGGMTEKRVVRKRERTWLDYIIKKLNCKSVIKLK